jgi:hypothetical protein
LAFVAATYERESIAGRLYADPPPTSVREYSGIRLHAGASAIS